MEPWRILFDAADLLERDGWCQGALFNMRGERCALGAIYHCTEHKSKVGDRDHYRASALFRRALQVRNVAKWNNAPERTKEEVIAKLREAARDARMAEIGEPERRRVLMPNEVPAAPLTPDSPLWTDPAPEEPNPIKVPEKVPA